MNTQPMKYPEGSVLPMSQLVDFHDRMKDNNIIMVYEGDFSQEVTKSVLAMTERKLNSEQVDEGTIRKIYNVMIECLQNICKHQLANPKEADGVSSVFMIGSTPEGFSIISGNPVSNDRMSVIQEKLDYINSLNAESMKEFYKKTRLSGVLEKRSGAGLGFIDMAKRTGNKLYYQFEPINKLFSYFTFMVTVPKLLQDN